MWGCWVCCLKRVLLSQLQEHGLAPYFTHGLYLVGGTGATRGIGYKEENSYSSGFSSCSPPLIIYAIYCEHTA